MTWQFVDLGELNFSSADLKKLPKVHAGFLVASSFAFNEIGVLLRVVLLALNSRKHAGKEHPIQTLAYVESLVALRLLSAKSVEYVKLFNDYTKKACRKEGEAGARFVSQNQREVADLEKASGYATAKWLRDSLSNHYLISEIEEFISRLPDKQVFSMFLNEKAGNSFYPLGEEVAMMGKLNQGGTAIQTLSEWEVWTRQAAKVIGAVHYGFSISLMEEFFPDKVVRMKRVIVDDKIIASPQQSTMPLLWDFRNAVGR